MTMLSAILCAGSVLKVDFNDPAAFRLKNGAVLKNGILYLNGGQSHAEIVGSENFKVGKKGLTISCIAAFDQLKKPGQDLLYKPDSWMLTRFDDGVMNGYLHNGKEFIGRTDGGKMAVPGEWKHYALVIEPIVQDEEGKYAHYCLWTETERETDDKSKPDLCGNLGFSWNAVLVLLEGLYVIIGKTEQSEPYGGYDKQNHVYIVQSADKKARDKYGYYDYYATHGGDSGLQVVLVELPQCLGNLFLLEVFYQRASEPC